MNDHPLVREIKDKLPAVVVHQIHLFFPWIEKRQERDLASKIAAYRKIRAAAARIAGLLAYPIRSLPSTSVPLLPIIME